MSSQDPANFEYEDRSPPFEIFLIVLTIISILAIALRFWSRSLLPTQGGRQPHSKRFWWDDWLALAAMPFLFAEFGLLHALVRLGLGRHIQTLSPKQTMSTLRLIFITYFMYDMAICIARASALLFLTRVFPRQANTVVFNVILWTLCVCNVAWLVGVVLGTIFLCRPVTKNWNFTITGTCGPQKVLWIGVAVPSVIIDLGILILPMPKIIWGLSISLARKVGIVAVFLLGYCVIVVSLGRLITVVSSGNALNIDLTYDGMPAVYWVTAEAPILLLGICIPSMLTLGRHLLYRARHALKY